MGYLEANLTEEELRQLAGALMGRLGGSKGGQTRATKLTAKRRSDIARKAARARWQKKPSTA